MKTGMISPFRKIVVLTVGPLIILLRFPVAIHSNNDYCEIGNYSLGDNGIIKCIYTKCINQTNCYGFSIQHYITDLHTDARYVARCGFDEKKLVCETDEGYLLSEPVNNTVTVTIPNIGKKAEGNYICEVYPMFTKNVGHCVLRLNNDTNKFTTTTETAQENDTVCNRCFRDTTENTTSVETTQDYANICKQFFEDTTENTTSVETTQDYANICKQFFEAGASNGKCYDDINVALMVVCILESIIICLVIVAILYARGRYYRCPRGLCQEDKCKSVTEEVIAATDVEDMKTSAESSELMPTINLRMKKSLPGPVMESQRNGELYTYLDTLLTQGDNTESGRTSSPVLFHPGRPTYDLHDLEPSETPDKGMTLKSTLYAC